MQHRDALAVGRAALRAAATETPELDAEVLLRHVAGLDRAALFTRLGEELEPGQETGYQALIERRRRGEPVAYITGEREFMGLGFLVDGRVLIPRPETETLVERALAYLPGDGSDRVVADVGTGCGAIAVSIAALRPGARVYATDTSAAALDVARENVRRVLGEDLTPPGPGSLRPLSPPARAHSPASPCRRGESGQGNVVLIRGPLLEGVPEQLDVVCANLPYIRTGEMERLPVSVRDFEPWSALDGGEDGLDVYRALLAEVPERLRSGGVVLMECDPGQAEALLGLALMALPGAKGEIVKDLASSARVVEVRR